MKCVSFIVQHCMSTDKAATLDIPSKHYAVANNRAGYSTNEIKTQRSQD